MEPPPIASDQALAVLILRVLEQSQDAVGSRPRLITALREALDEDETLERLRRVAIERMEAGDPAFWKMLLDRVWPARVELSAETESVVSFRWAGGETQELSIPGDLATDESGSPSLDPNTGVGSV